MTTIRPHDHKEARSESDDSDAKAARHARRYEIYIAERNAKLALDAEQSKFIDSAILSLGGGSLALLLTYLHGLSASPVWFGFVQFGAFALVLSIMLSLGSVVASQYSITRYIDDIDAEADRNFDPPMERSRMNRWVHATAWLNIAAFICLMIGIGGASLFAVVNMPLESAQKGTEANGQHSGLRKDSDASSGRRPRAGRNDQTTSGRAAATGSKDGHEQR
jgi:hypothetical protein